MYCYYCLYVLFVGSGSLAAMAVFESRYTPNMGVKPHTISFHFFHSFSFIRLKKASNLSVMQLQAVFLTIWYVPLNFIKNYHLNQKIFFLIQGSGSNVDICVITASGVDYIRPYDVANVKGER